MGLLKKLADRLKAIPREVDQTFWEKVGPQGASELAHALNSQSNAFVPYGHAQAPLDIEGSQSSYQATLRDASQRAGQEHDRGMEMDR
jgi:hypothetical protein